MEKKTPSRGKAARCRKKSQTTDPQHKDFFHAGQTPLSPRPARAMGATDGVDLVGLRERLLEARRRLVERIAEDYPADRRFPDSGWSRLLADIQLVIAAVDAVVAEGGS